MVQNIQDSLSVFVSLKKKFLNFAYISLGPRLKEKYD